MVKLFKVVALTLLVLWSWWSFEGAVGDPQLFLLTNECSGFTTANFDLSTFFQNLNASFADLREQVWQHPLSSPQLEFAEVHQMGKTEKTQKDTWPLQEISLTVLK